MLYAYDYVHLFKQIVQCKIAVDFRHLFLFYFGFYKDERVHFQGEQLCHFNILWAICSSSSLKELAVVRPTTYSFIEIIGPLCLVFHCQ